MNKRVLGQEKEELACRYLIDNGYKILEKNYRCKLGEIDIIATEDNNLVFVEVKYRATDNYGSSLEAVNCRKQAVIRRVANYYITTHYTYADMFCRFDVVGIDGDNITLIKDAF